MRTVLTLLMVLIAVTPAVAFALDLDSLKSGGQVGEANTGYIAAMGSQPAEVTAFVNSVNSKRRVRYSEVAATTKQSTSIVEKLAAQELVNRLSTGEFYQNAAGAWLRK